MSYPVEVYIYDLSQGMAQQLGPQVGLPDLTGVWHTSIVVHGLEIFFGGGGIEHCPPGATMMGPPLEKKHLGETTVSSEAMTAHLVEVGRSSFHGRTYDLFTHNCNNFSSEFAKFLGVQDIPQYILDLPKKVMASPIAAMLKPIMEQATPDGQGVAFGENDLQTPSSATSSESVHIPPKEWSIINTPLDIDKVMAKILEFNETNGTKFCVDGDHLTRLRLLAEDGVKIDDSILEEVLGPVLKAWPRDNSFPILHIICANVVRESASREVAEKLYALVKTNKLIDNSDSPQTRMGLRLLVSFFASPDSREVAVAHREDIIADVNTLVEDLSGETISPQVENAVSSLLMNYGKVVHDKGGDAEAAFQIVSGLSTVMLQAIKGPEALYKCTVTLGTLVATDEDVKALAQALDATSKLNRIPKGRMARLDACVDECKTLLADG